jgi:rubrerythrin
MSIKLIDNHIGIERKIFYCFLISVIIISIPIYIFRENVLLSSWILSIATLALVFVTYYYAYFNKKILKENEINREILFLGSRLENLYSYLIYQKYLLTDNSEEMNLKFEDYMMGEFREFIRQIRKFSFLARGKLLIKLQYWLELATKLELQYGHERREIPSHRIVIDELRKIGREIIKLSEDDYEYFNSQLYKLINEERSELSERCSRCGMKIPKLKADESCPACKYNPLSI